MIEALLVVLIITVVSLFVFLPFILLTNILEYIIMNKEMLIKLQEDAKAIAHERVLQKLADSYEKRMLTEMAKLIQEENNPTTHTETEGAY